MGVVMVTAADLPSSTDCILSSKIIDIDYETVTMGTNHVLDFLMVHTLVFLHIIIIIREREVVECRHIYTHIIMMMSI